MPLFIHRKADNYQWAIWKIAESETELLSLLPHPETYHRQMEKFKALSRRCEWLAVRVLLQEMIGEEKEIKYQESGKPYLADGSLNISISHTKGYATIILSKEKAVGIDIERFGHRVEKVTSHYMRDDEVAQPYQGDKAWSLLLHWSAKETVYKCLGLREVDLIQELRIFPFDIETEGAFQAQELKTHDQKIFKINYLLHPDFVLTCTLL
jgi:4'-phosphopantetheinyl transferase